MRALRSMAAMAMACALAGPGAAAPPEARNLPPQVAGALTPAQALCAQRYLDALPLQVRLLEAQVRESPAARALLPSFQLLGLVQAYAPDANRQLPTASFPMGPQATLLAMDAQCVRVLALHDSGNHESFGQLLRAAGVRIDAANANLVWTAFCELHGKAWLGGPHAQAGPRAWRLHVHETDFRAVSPSLEIRESYFYEVLTDDQGLVLSGMLKVETVASRPLAGARRAVRP